MTRFARRTAIVGAFVVGAFLAIFFGFLNHDRTLVACTGCQLPRPVFVAKVSIPKGTSGSAIATSALYSTKYVQRNQMVDGALIDPSEVRGEVTIRTIPAGARLTAADFALRGPIYYPAATPRAFRPPRPRPRCTTTSGLQASLPTSPWPPAFGWMGRPRKPLSTSTLRTEPWSATAVPSEPSKPTIRRSRSQQSAGEPNAAPNAQASFRNTGPGQRALGRPTDIGSRTRAGSCRWTSSRGSYVFLEVRGIGVSAVPATLDSWRVW
jgi:hypothetical protein